jgi:iron complex outermembrane receptor protein
MNFKSKMMLGVGATALILAANGTASAQSTSTPSSNTIDEVVVTATKTGTTNLQKTPLAVAVVSGDALEASQVVNIRELQSLVPALRVTQNSDQMILYVRGVGGRQYGGESGVSLYVDGVYLSTASVAMSSNFNDLERVEVLKGPQGTTFGRNSSGGAVNFISRAPTDEFHIRSTVNVGNFNLYELSTNVSGPIVEGKLQGSVAISRVKRDGHIENIVPGGQDLGGADRWAGRTQLRWEPLSNVVNTLRAEMGYTDEAYATRTAAQVLTNDSRLTGTNNYNAPLANSIFGDYSKAALNTPSRDREQVYGVSNDLSIKINDNLTLKSLTAYRSLISHAHSDGDATELPLTLAGINNYNQHQFSEELNLEHNFGRLSGVVGLYYFDEYLYFRSDGVSPVSIVRAVAQRTFQNSLLPTKSAAIFAQETFHLTDSVSFLVGARYTKERKGFDQVIQQEIFNPGFPNHRQISGFGSHAFVTHKWVHSVTPKFGVNWQASENAFFYASATKGYKNGGYVASAFTNVGADYGPETLWSYEVGAKTDWFDRRLRVNVSLFKYDYKGLQFTTVIAPMVTATTNAAAAELTGMDVEFTAKPAKGLTLTGDASFLPTARYTDFKTLSASNNYRLFLVAQGDTRLNPATGVYDASGKRIVVAPKVALTLTAQQDFDLSDGSNFYVRGEYNYTSTIQSDATNVKIAEVGPVSLYNASVGYMAKSGNWNIALWGRNLGDKQWVNLITPTPRPIGNPGMPRTFGVRLNLNY